ncbi:EVE domain-containing protein [Halobacteriovorax sp.]|uniref:EVE domain-containing protein n=1 Tax=Halobacteriovorax sp. TaxID=2020862 RepID=UPI003AF2396D
MQYWLFKSEPDAFSIDDLAKRPKQTESWDGVRNYQARNFMRDEIKMGDKVFFYHSSCKEPAIVGIAEVVKESHPDKTQFDKNSKYYDPKATKEEPRWFLVDIKFEEKFEKQLSLKEMKADKRYDEMPLVKKGSRLSIMPIPKKIAKLILKDVKN